MTQALRHLEHALEATYGSDQRVEAACVLDRLTDLGWTLTPSPGTRVPQDELPLVSTKQLTKRRNP